MRARFLAPVLLLALALPGCATRPAGVPADDNLNAVLWIQHSLEFELNAEGVYRAAGRLLDEALADPRWDAIDPAERHVPADALPPAIIVDIDETVLDNSAYQARLIRNGDEYQTGSWAAWVEEARARPVPGAREFLAAAAARGVTIFYVTNREHGQEAPTLRNLRAYGFPVDEAVPVYLGLGMDIPGCSDIGQNKRCRRQWIAARYRVLMQFGDQLSDFVDIGANTPASRREALAPRRDWNGERWFMLPNPGYGYWEPALFDNDWELPREQRRARKREALRTD